MISDKAYEHQNRIVGRMMDIRDRYSKEQLAYKVVELEDKIEGVEKIISKLTQANIKETK